MRKAWLLAGLILATATTASAASRPATQPSPDPDVIVVGAGISGLSAALEAARGGARVHVLDMWSVFGGHAVMAEGGVAIVGSPVQERQAIHDTPEIAFGDFTTYGEDPDTEWVHDYVTRSRVQVFDWLAELGVGFTGTRKLPGNSVPRFHDVEGRGLGLVGPIYRACVRHEAIAFEWNVQVTSLVADGARVLGVRGRSLRTGQALERRARAVVLATGGFQSNLALVREFWPRNLPFPERLLAGSGVNSRGSGLGLAKEAGAALDRLDHQWNYPTGLPDPRHPGANRGLNAQAPGSIWVNAQGRRFTDENGSARDSLAALLAQKPVTYWAIFDERAKRRFWVSGSDWADFATIERLIFADPSLVKSAPSLESLAAAAGLPAAELVASVERANRMAAAGKDDDFGRRGEGFVGPLSAIGTPPFYAVQFFPLTRKSMGGVRIDRATRVLDRSGAAIRGLYAVGELSGLAGINGKAGLEGTFLGPSIFTGRAAGRAVVAELALSPRPTQARSATPQRPSAGKRTDSLCMACHPLATLVKATRPGYAHFEGAHARVLEGRLVCARCHAEISPRRDEAHRTDPEAQIATCAACHLATRR